MSFSSCCAADRAVVEGAGGSVVVLEGGGSVWGVAGGVGMAAIVFEVVWATWEPEEQPHTSVPKRASVSPRRIEHRRMG
jgi:hypothetical protein